MLHLPSHDQDFPSIILKTSLHVHNFPPLLFKYDYSAPICSSLFSIGILWFVDCMLPMYPPLLYSAFLFTSNLSLDKISPPMAFIFHYFCLAFSTVSLHNHVLLLTLVQWIILAVAFLVLGNCFWFCLGFIWGRFRINTPTVVDEPLYSLSSCLLTYLYPEPFKKLDIDYLIFCNGVYCSAMNFISSLTDCRSFSSSTQSNQLRV